jgi:hypothetical protein
MTTFLNTGDGKPTLCNHLPLLAQNPPCHSSSVCEFLEDSSSMCQLMRVMQTLYPSWLHIYTKTVRSFLQNIIDPFGSYILEHDLHKFSKELAEQFWSNGGSNFTLYGRSHDMGTNQEGITN